MSCQGQQSPFHGSKSFLYAYSLENYALLSGLSLSRPSLQELTQLTSHGRRQQYGTQEGLISPLRIAFFHLQIGDEDNEQLAL